AHFASANNNGRSIMRRVLFPLLAVSVLIGADAPKSDKEAIGGERRGGAREVGKKLLPEPGCKGLTATFKPARGGDERCGPRVPQGRRRRFHPRPQGLPQNDRPDAERRPVQGQDVPRHLPAGRGRAESLLRLPRQATAEDLSHPARIRPGPGVLAPEQAVSRG